MLGTPIVILQEKLKRLKQFLKTFNKVHYSDISMKVKGKRVELDGIRRKILSNNPKVDPVQLERALTLELYDLMLVEESFNKQKYQIQWIQEGDSNTKFFNKTVAARQSKNTILSLVHLALNRLSTHSQIANEV